MSSLQQPRTRRLALVGVVVVVIAAAWLAFGYFGVHTLFVDDEVAEEAPVFDSGPAADQAQTEEQSGQFVDRSHPTSGTAVVLADGTGQRFLRLEEFATDNGPDLNVYLTSADADADTSAFDDDFVDLGDLKGNVGAQNYEIPRDVDLTVYDTVVIWCVRFGVAFGAADLTPGEAA